MQAKISLPWNQALIRGFLANWLVNLAVWNTVASSSLPGKLLGLWPPITAFVAMGLEHCVANMWVADRRSTAYCGFRRYDILNCQCLQM